jgi:hypothetical protein
MEEDFPYDPKTQNEIKTFFKNKLKSKKKYTYSISNDGDLETYDSKTGELINLIKLKYYRPLTKDEIDIMEKERLDNIIKIEEQIDIQKAMLRKAYEEYKQTKIASDVLRINQEITGLEAQKSSLRSPVRELIDLESVEKRSIYFDMPHEKRKEELVYKMFYRDFPLWKLYGMYTDSKETYETIEKKRISLVPGEVVLTNGKIARIFGAVEDEYNGFMSIYNINDFVYQETRFSSPYQAFEAKVNSVETANGIQLVRGSTVIAGGVNTTDNMGYYVPGAATTQLRLNHNFSVLDNPATTSATTYLVQARPFATANSMQIISNFSGQTSSIILLEIGA